MIIITKKNVLLLNICVGFLIIIFLSLRLHNAGIINLYFKKRKTNDHIIKAKLVVPTMTTPLKIPWRYHIEEDGFVFPRRDEKERFITYEQLNGSWTKQIIQFENAVIFAHLLKRTLLIPPLFLHHVAVTNDQSTSRRSKQLKDFLDTKLKQKNIDSMHFMSEIIDFDLLSSMLKLGEINTKQLDDVKRMERYNVCHDPRLGFWLDYIPSVENIQTWRLLKEQYFSPLKLMLRNNEEPQYICPGTEHYIDRWGPPLTVKALYRGILTELYNRPEDLLYFQGNTLDTQQIRFFSKQRTKQAQQLLLFYIRFSKKVTRQTKHLAKMLGHGYTAILANRIHGPEEGLPEYIMSQVLKFEKNGSSPPVLIICNRTKRYVFDGLKKHGLNVTFAHSFIEANLPDSSKENRPDKLYLLSLLLCAYATNFIGLPGTRDLYFVEHLRLQDTVMLDGLVTDKVSVRWAKHTMRDRADERKVLLRSTLKTFLKEHNKNMSLNKPPQRNTTIYITHDSKMTTAVSKKATFLKPKKKQDRLHSIACIFCNYVRYVTGQHGCPTMKHLC